MLVTMILNIMNPRRRVKSIAPHFEIPIIDGVLGDPRRELTKREKQTRKILIA